MMAFAMGIGGTEILVILVLALILFSPRELPGMLRSAMKFWGSIKRTADEFKDTIMQEESLQDIRDAYDGTKAHLRAAQTDARRELNKARSEVRRAQSKLAKATKVREKVEASKTDAAPATSEPAQAPPKFDPADRTAAAATPAASETAPTPHAAAMTPPIEGRPAPSSAYGGANKR